MPTQSRTKNTPKNGLISRSLPKIAAAPTYRKNTKPSTRSSGPNHGPSTIVATHAGARRGSRPSTLKRGSRQARASTVNETASAAQAPAMAYSAGIGRSLAPPIPWAKILKSADLDLDDDLFEVVRLDVDDPRLVEGHLVRRGAGVVGDLLLRRRVHVQLSGCVSVDV